MIRRGISFSLIVLFWMSYAAKASTEREVKFQGANGATLIGTIQLPASEGMAPAMALLSGSGPTNRDGNQPPAIKTDLLKQIAEALADQGIATLRFDKRGMYANSADLPKDPSRYGDFFSWENFVGDAASAVRFLRQQREIDKDRVGILGHSEGGLLALEAAHLLKSEAHPPAVLILIGTPGRSMDAVITDQLKALLIRQRATREQTVFFLGENARITREILHTGKVPPDVPPGLAALYPSYLGKFLHSELALDLCKLAADFAGPVMIVAGSADRQVSPELDAKALDSALSTREDDQHTLAIVPNASHNLKLTKGPVDPAFEGPVAPAAMERLQKWSVAHLLRQ